MRNKWKYSQDWTDIIRPAILKRDQYKCQRCGVKHKSIGYFDKNKIFVEADEFVQDWCKRNNIKLVKIFLNVCHLDHNPSNNTYSNLKSFCPRCHGINDAQHRHIVRISQH